MAEQFVYGVHAVKALLANPTRTIKKLWLSQERDDQQSKAVADLALERRISVDKLSPKKMNERFPDVVHQGMAALVTPMREWSEYDLEELLSQTPAPHLILILDGVTDPHNLGACLRSADAAGVACVIIPKDKNATITAAVSKVACGAAETIPLVRVTNLARVMEQLKEAGIWIYGAAGEATSSIYELDCKSSMAIVMGAEGDGLRRLTRERCDGLFSLPMMGVVSSLNVSVATGISLYEVVRQRLK